MNGINGRRILIIYHQILCRKGGGNEAGIEEMRINAIIITSDYHFFGTP